MYLFDFRLLPSYMRCPLLFTVLTLLRNPEHRTAEACVFLSCGYSCAWLLPQGWGCLAIVRMVFDGSVSLGFVNCQPFVDKFGFGFLKLRLICLFPLLRSTFPSSLSPLQELFCAQLAIDLEEALGETSCPQD